MCNERLEFEILGEIGTVDSHETFRKKYVQKNTAL